MIKTDLVLTTQVAVITNETIAGADTAARIGQMFQDIVDSKPNLSAVSITAKVHLTAAQILASFTTPLTLVAAPGAGIFIRPTSIVFVNNFLTTAFSSPNSMSVNVGSLTPFTSALFQSANNAIEFRAMATTSSVGSLDCINVPLLLKTTTANPTLGDGSMDIYITYSVITL